MKMIKNLNKNLVKADSRFHLREDLNFADDGSLFRGFDYKGLPIVTLREDGITYCSIRVSYLDNKFTSYEWDETEESKLENKFIGVDEIDLDKFIETCEKIIAKVNELNDKCENEILDMNKVLARLEYECLFIEMILNKAKRELKWWELDKWDFDCVKGHYNSLSMDYNRCVKLIESIKDGSMDKKKQRHCYKKLEKYGHIEVFKDEMSVRNLMDKCK